MQGIKAQTFTGDVFDTLWIKAGRNINSMERIDYVDNSYIGAMAGNTIICGAINDNSIITGGNDGAFLRPFIGMKSAAMSFSDQTQWKWLVVYDHLNLDFKTFNLCVFTPSDTGTLGHQAIIAVVQKLDGSMNQLFVIDPQDSTS